MAPIGDTGAGVGRIWESQRGILTSISKTRWISYLEPLDRVCSHGRGPRASIVVRRYTLKNYGFNETDGHIMVGVALMLLAGTSLAQRGVWSNWRRCVNYECGQARGG